MNNTTIKAFIAGYIILSGLIFYSCKEDLSDKVVSYIADQKKYKIEMFWKNDSNRIISNIQNLEDYVERKDHELLFAMNGGMFHYDFSPVDLFIENNIELAPLNTQKGEDNFYMKPNGVFYITMYCMFSN